MPLPSLVRRGSLGTKNSKGNRTAPEGEIVSSLSPPKRRPMKLRAMEGLAPKLPSSTSNSHATPPRGESVLQPLSYTPAKTTPLSNSCGTDGEDQSLPDARPLARNCTRPPLPLAHRDVGTASAEKNVESLPLPSLLPNNERNIEDQGKRLPALIEGPIEGSMLLAHRALDTPPFYKRIAPLRLKFEEQLEADDSVLDGTQSSDSEGDDSKLDSPSLPSAFKPIFETKDTESENPSPEQGASEADHVEDDLPLTPQTGFPHLPIGSDASSQSRHHRAFTPPIIPPGRRGVIAAPRSKAAISSRRPTINRQATRNGGDVVNLVFDQTLNCFVDPQTAECYEIKS
eukprot:TRINITY_DN7299_c0_g1_i1.p1 TRINITY_DN7299_c0_g1~~TRINITY_DN7299_c0_g1_i1.p1  ORF type:complete len:343 (-),score=58.99 TRINITY_DN7299_c0_g1_i1:564-1592(-)